MSGDMLTEIRFWAQVVGDARCTVVCPPDIESRCKGYVDARGLGDLITVRASPYVPADRIFVIDEPAMDASLTQQMLRAIREEWRP